MSEERYLTDAIFKAGLTVHLVLGKAQEILRKLHIKLPVGNLKKAEICRSLIAIEVACSILNIQLDKAKLMAQVSISPKLYQEGLINCKQVLKVQRDSDVTQKLAVHFGFHLKSSVHDVLEKYKRDYIDKLHPNQRALVDIKSSVCQAAAFYVVGIRNKVKLIRSEVASVAEVDASHLITITDMMTLVVKTEKTANSNLEMETKKRRTVYNDVILRKEMASIPCTKNMDKTGNTGDTDSANDTVSHNLININGIDYKNPEPLSKTSEITSAPNGCRKISVNPLDVKNRKNDSSNSLRNKVHEEKLEHDQFIAERENQKNGVREKYDRWKESLEKKRKQNAECLSPQRQPLCNIRQN